MDSLRINTGEKRIMVNDDPSRVISFNPTDVGFAERFYGLVKTFEDKLKEYEARSAAVDAVEGVDHNGLPLNLAEKLSLIRDACEFIRGQIDQLFGAGTSQAAFGDAMTMEMFAQFFNGIAPFVQTARAVKLEQYAYGAKKRRVMKGR